MNSIPTIQNTDRQLQRLAAQRQLYATAKKVFGAQLIVSAPLAVGLAFAVIIFPSLKCYVALWGILVALCGTALLMPWQKRLRYNAARIQELFDCDVLELPWNEVKVDKRPDPELIQEQSEKYKSWASKMPPLTDWYAKSVGELPLYVARIACQRSNCWWDAKQRRRYAVVVIVCTVVVFLAVLLLAMSNGATIENFVLMVLAPLAPALLLGYRQYTEQMEAASRLTKLKGHAESLWDDVLSGKSTESGTTAKARVLQDEIFENRSKSPLVFDALFARLRDDFEAQMNYGVTDHVAEAKQKLGMEKGSDLGFK